MMSSVTRRESTHSLEYGLLWLIDEGDVSALPRLDPAAGPVAANESSIAISAMHQVDGDVHVSVFVNESNSSAGRPVELGRGRITFPTGRLTISGTPDFAVADHLVVTRGSYEFVVFGDEIPFTGDVAIVLLASLVEIHDAHES